jgi:WD40 repeat protein
VWFWDARTKQNKNKLYFDGNIEGVAYDAKGGLFYAIADTRLRFWDLTNNSRHDSVRRVNKIALSPDGRFLATADLSRSVTVLEVGRPPNAKAGEIRGGVPMFEFREHSQPVTAVAFSPDSARLATGSQDRTVIVWDATNPKSFVVLRGHSSAVTSVAFDPEGERLATGSDEGTVKIWAVPGSKEPLALRSILDQKAKRINDLVDFARTHVARALAPDDCGP